MSSQRFFHFAAALLLLGLPALAMAHPGHDGHEVTWDFRAGLLHPVGGWDHLLATLTVGLWAARWQRGGRCGVLGAFLLALAVGAFWGLGRAVPPGMEVVLAISVMALGLMLATSERIAPAVTLLLGAGFAVLHGFAHGAVPPSGPSTGYLAGMFVTSTLLLGTGLAAGMGLQRARGRWRCATGLGIAAAGALLLAR